MITVLLSITFIILVALCCSSRSRFTGKHIPELYGSSHTKNNDEENTKEIDVLDQPMILSYSLWGDAPCYNYGMLENALMAREYYKNALVYVYADIDTIIPEVLRILREIPYVEIIPSRNKCMYSTRFAPCFDSDLPVLSRDADSRITSRESAAVREWLESDKDFHIMRDEPNGHWSSIMGGMFGVRNGAMKPFSEQFNKGIKDSQWNCDQDFLNKNVYPQVIQNAFIHDEYKTYFNEEQSRTFPKSGESHVGQVDCESYQRASAIIGKPIEGSYRPPINWDGISSESS